MLPESAGFWPQAGNRRFPAMTKDACGVFRTTRFAHCVRCSVLARRRRASGPRDLRSLAVVGARRRLPEGADGSLSACVAGAPRAPLALSVRQGQPAWKPISWWTERARPAPGSTATQAPQRSEERSEPGDRSRLRAFEVSRFVAERFSTNHPARTAFPAGGVDNGGLLVVPIRGLRLRRRNPRSSARGGCQADCPSGAGIGSSIQSS